MKPSYLLTALAGQPVACAVTAYGSVRVTEEALPALRQRPGGGRAEGLPAAFLKHSDEQTVAGVAAVFQAIEQFGLHDTDFTDWGVLAGPRFLGRAILAVMLQRFALEGAWGVSPHLIPHRSLHSVSGTVSQALGIHGPNFGVGGGPASASEVMLTAAALLSEGKVPGLWVVLSALLPEPTLAKPQGEAIQNYHFANSVYAAAALALTPLASEPWKGPVVHAKASRDLYRGLTPSARPEDCDAGSIMQVQVSAEGPLAHPGRKPGSGWPWFDLESLQQVLDRESPGPAAWRLACGGWMKLEPVVVGAEKRP